MAEEPSPACCRQVRRRGARQRPPVDGSWFVDLLWSLPSTAAHFAPPGARVKAGRRPPEGRGLDTGEDGAILGLPRSGFTPRFGDRRVSPCRARRSRVDWAAHVAVRV